MLFARREHRCSTFAGLVALTVSLGAGVTHAEVSLPAVIGDNMVLQQGRPVPIWGTAAPGEEISVAFGAEQVKAKAGANG